MTPTTHRVALAAALSLAHCVPAGGGFRGLDRIVTDRLGREARVPCPRDDELGAIDSTVRARLVAAESEQRQARERGSAWLALPDGFRSWKPGLP